VHPPHLYAPPLASSAPSSQESDLAADEAVAATTRSHKAAEESALKANKVVQELRPALAEAEKEAKRLDMLRVTVKKAVDCAKKFEQHVQPAGEQGAGGNE